MNRHLIALAAFILAAPGSALACTMVPPAERPSQTEVDRTARDMLGWADQAIEIEVMRPTGVSRRPPLVRVLRVVKGSRFRRGAVLQAVPMGSAACGPDRLERGARGLVLLRHLPRRGEPLIIPRFVEPAIVASLVRQGLLANR